MPTSFSISPSLHVIVVVNENVDKFVEVVRQVREMKTRCIAVTGIKASLTIFANNCLSLSYPSSCVHGFFVLLVLLLLIPSYNCHDPSLEMKKIGNEKKDC